MLVEIVERRSPETNRKSVVYCLKCDACGAPMEGSKVRYERSRFHFCDTACMGRHKREHYELYPDNGKARNTPEACAKAMATRKRRMDAGEIQHPWTGRRHSEETKQRLKTVASDGRRKGKGNGMYGRTHTEETRAKMSEAKARLIMSGQFRPHAGHKKGYYTSTRTGKECFFRSSWEEALMKHLDVDPTVMTWEYESFRISYTYNDNLRWHVPDFLITRADGTSQLLEVKPKEFVESERVKLKAEACLAWCAQNGVTYQVVTRAVLQEWGIVVG